MKRLCDWIFSDKNEVIDEIPTEIWRSIINLYHLVRYIEQWRDFKEIARENGFYILPSRIENIKIPMYRGWPTLNEEIVMCPQIYRIEWTEKGDFFGVCVETFHYHLAYLNEPRRRGYHLSPIVILNTDIEFTRRDLATVASIVAPVTRRRRENEVRRFGPVISYMHIYMNLDTIL